MSKIKKNLTKRNELYYIKNNHLNYHDFKEPDIYDKYNREYKIFYEKDSKNPVIDGLGSLKLNVKIPKDSRWFDNNDIFLDQEFKFFNHEIKGSIILRIDKHYRKDNRAKTGYVFVSGSGVKQLLNKK